MKFKGISSRIILSIVPIIAISTALFIFIVHSITSSQIGEQIDERMGKSLDTAALMMEKELIGSSSIARSLAMYMEICEREAIE
ncbi:MAG: hypothetical protein LBJ10_03085, partial [Clostridiales bacterium]|nr:hypothetical protein [Clostridiales bacterium]